MMQGQLSAVFKPLVSCSTCSSCDERLCCVIFEKARIRLIDFKLEFGRHGWEIILCDEILPESCRLWDMETDKKLDKDRFRRDLGDGAWLL